MIGKSVRATESYNNITIDYVYTVSSVAKINGYTYYELEGYPGDYYLARRFVVAEG